MSSSKSSLRNQLRNVHILASAGLGAFLYSPWRNSASSLTIMSAVVFPLLTLSGFWMWQGPRISRWLKKRKSATPETPTNV